MKQLTGLKHRNNSRHVNYIKAGGAKEITGTDDSGIVHQIHNQRYSTFFS